MSDISTPNFIILGGGPMALLSAYYIDLLIPSASIVILDNRGYYARSNYDFTINNTFIDYLKITFKNDNKFIDFLDILTKNILNNCITFPINMLEQNLYKKLQHKIFIIKCNISLDNGNLSIFPAIDHNEFWINISDNTHPPNGTTIKKIVEEHYANKYVIKYVNRDDTTIEYKIADEKYKKGIINFEEITIQDSCCKRQLEFLTNLKPNYILNCTGGRLNTNEYWKENAEKTKVYLSELIISCVNNSVNNMDIINEHLNNNENNEYIFPSMENPLWYGKGIRVKETHGVVSNAILSDIISFLKPSISININLNSVKTCYLFNIGDSIMRVDYTKKIGLGLGMTHIKILLDIINDGDVNANLDELFVKNIEDNFHTLSTPNDSDQFLPLFCSIGEFKILYGLNKKHDEFKKENISIFFTNLQREGIRCRAYSMYEWPIDDIRCTLVSNPDNLTKDELNKNKCIINKYNINQKELFEAINSNKNKTSAEFIKLLDDGRELKKQLKEQNLYHLTTKLVHLEDGKNLYGTEHKAGDIVIDTSAETMQKTIKKTLGSRALSLIGKKGGKVKKTKKNIYKKNFSKMKKNFNKTKRKRIKTTKKNKKKKSRR